MDESNQELLSFQACSQRSLDSPIRSLDASSTKRESLLIKDFCDTFRSTTISSLDKMNRISYEPNNARSRRNTGSSGTSMVALLRQPIAPPAGVQGAMTGFRPNSSAVSISSIIPGPLYPSEAQLTVAYGYAVRRGDGSIVPLLPADELHTLSNVFYAQGPEGYIVVPEPRNPVPNPGQPSNVIVDSSIVRALPPLSFQGQQGRTQMSQIQVDQDQINQLQEDPTQRAIDTIIQRTSYVDPSSIGAISKTLVPGALQSAHIPVASSLVGPPASTVTPSASQKSLRKPKIYCDKWIHDGTCAFTQIGCRYKHEMPMDTETQLTLGLNNGLPFWYRRAHGLLTPGRYNSGNNRRNNGNIGSDNDNNPTAISNDYGGVSGNNYGGNAGSAINSGHSNDSHLRSWRLPKNENTGEAINQHGPTPRLLFEHNQLRNVNANINPFSALSSQNIKYPDDDDDDDGDKDHMFHWQGRGKGPYI